MPMPCAITAGVSARTRSRISIAIWRQFADRVEALGGRVHWAETATTARAIVLDLARTRGVGTIVKSKSMVTEELELNPALEAAGLRVIETDLGEYVAQLAHEAAVAHHRAHPSQDPGRRGGAVSREAGARRRRGRRRRRG